MRRMLILVAALALAALSVAAVASADRGHRGDRNHDGLPDRWERHHHLSLKVNQAHRDPDRDKLDNRNEFRHGTDPNKRDTDDDGVRDRDEVNPAGTIASFDNGVLTITLRGQSVSGRVTAETKIECENEDEDNAMAARGGGGDNSGPGSTGSGRVEENENEVEVEDENENEVEHSGTTTTTTPSSNSGPGSANSGPGDENEDEDRACGTDALEQGATVKEAEAKLTSNGLVFEEIELA
jgi:hypothetical protein